MKMNGDEWNSTHRSSRHMLLISNTHIELEFWYYLWMSQICAILSPNLQKRLQIFRVLKPMSF